MAEATDTPGKRLRKARIAAGFSNTEDVADQMGLSAPAIRHHENGQRGISVRIAQRYANLYKVSWQWIISGEESETENDLDRQFSELWGRLSASNKIKAIEIMEILMRPDDEASVG